MKKIRLVIGALGLLVMGNAAASPYCDSAAKWAEGTGNVNELGKTRTWAAETVRNWFSISQANGQYPGMTKKEAYQIVDMVYDNDYGAKKARDAVSLACKKQESKGLRLFDELENNAASNPYCDSVAKWAGRVGKANSEGRTRAYNIEVTRDRFSAELANGAYPGMRMDDAYAIVDLIYMHDMSELIAKERIKVICDHVVSRGLRLTSKAR